MPDSQLPETPDATPEQGSHVQQPDAVQDAVQFEVETTTPSGHTSAWSRLWNTGGVIHRPLTVRQKLWRIGGLLLTLGLVAILLFGQQISSFTANAWVAAFPRPQAALPTCLADGAWSPSGSQLAILGYQGQCGASGHLAGVLNIYDSAGRLRRRQIPLDPLLAPAFKTLPRAVNTDRISLGQVIWFSGEKQLAITFSLPPRSDIGETTTQFGIIVLDPIHPTAHPIVHFYGIPNRPGSSYPWLDTGVVWDLKTDQNTMLSGALTFEFWNNPLPLAYQYTWNATGALAPAPAIGGGTQATQAIGNPQGDASFQLWQSGELAALQQADLPYPLIGAQATWQTTFAASSPDGRYVFAPVTMSSPVSPRIARASPQDPENTGLPPILLARDAGFAHIMRSIPQYAPGAAQPLIYVAWRPDGKAIATFNLANDQKLTIYDCATGRLLASHAEPAQPTQFDGVLGALRWSPDGHHLLLPDGAILTM